MTIFPDPLKPGDTIVVVAPAGNLTTQQDYVNGCAILEEMGYKIAHRSPMWPGYGYLADNDQNRVAELHDAFLDPEIKAVFALRGGFGSLRLLEFIDVSIITTHPKFLVGFSDITILHEYFQAHSDLVSLHGPGITSLQSCDRPSIERLAHSLRGNWHHTLEEDIQVLRGGMDVSGRLRGGNLSSLVTLCGTPWSPDLSGSILFLEDVNEPPYRIDRLLTQFKLCGMLDTVCGIILGEFSTDRETDQNRFLRIHEFVWNRVLELTAESGIPIWGDFPIGHGSRNITMPIGAQTTMCSRNGRLSFTLQ